MLSLFCIGISLPAAAFNDVSPQDPNIIAFNHLNELGILTHDDQNNLNLSQNITRAEALTIALRTGGIAIPSNFDPTLLYDDVDPNSWYAPSIARAVELRIVKGRYENFRPLQTVTKAEFLAFLFNATKTNLRPYYKTQNIAEDIPDDSWMTPFFAYAKRYQIAHLPSDNHYLPQKMMTRREAALMAYRQLRLFHGNEETYLIVELQATIQQFLGLIKSGNSEEAEFFVHKILKINDRLTRTKNSQDAIAAKSISRSMEHLSDSLRQVRYGKNLAAVENLLLAGKQAARAEAKSEQMAPFARELQTLISETLLTFTTQPYQVAAQ